MNVLVIIIDKQKLLPFSLKRKLCILVPAPQHLSLEKQLNKSVLIGWTPPDPPGNQLIESYHVYVNGVLKVTVKANERTRALVEGVDLNRVCIAYAFLFKVIKN